MAWHHCEAPRRPPILAKKGNDVTDVSHPTAAWVDDSYVASWAAADGLAGLLELPWRMASLLVGLDHHP